MQQIKKILFTLTLLISSLVSQVLAEGVSCYSSEIRTKSNGGSVLLDDVNVEGELSDHQRNMQNYVGQAMRQGQQDFLKHPVTKATANALLFVATGGVEGAVSLVSGGKTAFNIVKNSRLSDWFRSGKTVVSNQITVGTGTPGATVTWGVKGGGNLAKTGKNMGFHYHIHKYNWYKPWTWFKQTPIIKPPKP